MKTIMDIYMTLLLKVSKLAEELDRSDDAETLYDMAASVAGELAGSPYFSDN